MPNVLEKAVLEDDLAVSLARALTTANARARSEGLQVAESIISTTEREADGISYWRISYGSRNVNRRGGDLIIDVRMQDYTVQKILRGQ
jgi:hypothetical protein